MAVEEEEKEEEGEEKEAYVLRAPKSSPPLD